MTYVETIVRNHTPSPRRGRSAVRGFTLLELVVATAVFLVVAGAAFSLFNRHLALTTHQQSLSGVNIGLRNAMSQLEIDLANAGQNLLSTVPSAGQSFSLGVIINNNVPGVAATCTPGAGTWSYPIPSACFDSLTVVNPKGCPVLDIQDPGNSQESLSTSSTMWGDDPNNSGNDGTDAACYLKGDEVLVIQLPTGGVNQVGCDSGSFGYCLAVVTLTKDALVSGGKVQLQHNPTGASSDPLGIMSNVSGGTNFAKGNALTTKFSDGAYIIDLGDGSNDITYAVEPNAANANDPQLMRCGGTVCAAGNEQLLADQVVGFKVGASLWDNSAAGATDIANYYFNSANYCSDAIGTADCSSTTPPTNDPNDFTLVRSIRISMIARTTPNQDSTLVDFQNGFDGGPYLVQQASTVVDLRNLSINEFGN